MSGRITYNSINADLVRPFNLFEIRNNTLNSVRQAISGVKTYHNFYDQDFVVAGRNLLTAQEVAELWRFYEYAKDGSTFAFTCNKDLADYIAYEGKSLVTNDEGAGTFTRTASNFANYLDPSTNVYTQLIDVNDPRFPAGKYGSGIIIEGARTNLCEEANRWADQSPSATWVLSNITESSDTGETADIVGTNNADKLTATAANGTATYTTTTAISTDDGVFSVFLKSPSGNVAAKVRISSSSAGALTTENITVVPDGPEPNGFTRFSAVHESSGSVAGNWEIEIEIDTNTDVIYAYGAQLEVGTDVLFASQPMFTQGATGTRNTEKLTYSAANMNRDKGTVMFWIRPEWIYDKHPTAVLFHSGVSNTNRHLSMSVTSAGAWEARLYKQNSTSLGVAVTPSASGLSQNTDHHVTCTYDGTVAKIELFLDGASISSSTVDPFTVSDVSTTLGIGVFHDTGVSPAFSVFDDVAIFRNVLTAGEINNIYNMGKGLGYRRNRWSSMHLTNPDFNPVQRVGNIYELNLEMEEALT